MLAALCDIFDCSPNDLIQPFILTKRTPRAMGADLSDAVDLNSVGRPRRARVDPDTP